MKLLQMINIVGGALLTFAAIIAVSNMHNLMRVYSDFTVTATATAMPNHNTMQHTFDEAIHEISELNYSQMINETSLNRFALLSIEFMLQTLSNKTILFFGDSLIRFQFSYLISVLFYCTDIHSGIMPDSLQHCPAFCDRYKHQNTSLIFTKCETEIFYQFHRVIGFANKILKHSKYGKYSVYHIGPFNLTLICIDKWAQNLANAHTEIYKLSSFQFELLHLANLPHLNYDILITNMVGMHFNAVKSAHFEQPMSFYMHRFMEYAIADFITDERTLHSDTKCLIIGTINSLCYEGFFGGELPMIKEWVRMQSKVYLFPYFYDKFTENNRSSFDFEEWILRNASKIHSNPTILAYIPKDLEFDSFTFYNESIHNFANKNVTHFFKFTANQQNMLAKCSELLQTNGNLYKNTSVSYRQNTCLLYARTPLSTNIIAERFRKTVKEFTQFSNVYYYDQHKLMRNYEHLCTDDWFVAVHFPPMYYIEFMAYVNFIYNGC